MKWSTKLGRCLLVSRWSDRSGLAEPTRPVCREGSRCAKVRACAAMRLDVATNGDTARKNACATKAKPADLAGDEPIVRPLRYLPRQVRKGRRSGPNGGPGLIVPTEREWSQGSEESSSALWKCGNRRSMCSRLTSCEDGRTAAGIPLLRIPALDTRCLSAASRAAGCAWFPERILR